MYINTINNINFTANHYKKIYVDKEALSKIKNSAKSSIRKDFYNNIDSYLDKKFTKKEFLQNINKMAQKIDNKVKLKDAEKQYIDDMLTTMDLSAKKENIPNTYILENINELIKNQ